MHIRDDQYHFLTLLGPLLVRLPTERAAWGLNCQPHGVPVLVSAQTLKRFSHPQPNSVKHFAMAKVGTHQGPRLVSEGDERRHYSQPNHDPDFPGGGIRFMDGSFCLAVATVLD